MLPSRLRVPSGKMTTICPRSILSAASRTMWIASRGSSRSTKRLPAFAIAYPNRGTRPSSLFARNRTSRGRAMRKRGMSTRLWWFAARMAPPAGRFSSPSTRTVHPPIRTNSIPHHRMMRDGIRSSPVKTAAVAAMMEEITVRIRMATDFTIPEITSPLPPGNCKRNNFLL